MSFWKHSMILLSLLVNMSCSHIKSGKYIEIRSGDSLDDLAKTHGITPAELINHNKGTNFKVGNWYFIPQHIGLISLFRTEKYSGQNFSSEYYKTGKFLWPVPASTQISSHFGKRWGKQHEGMDIKAKRGKEILAAEDGFVSYAGNKIKGYGKMIVITHAGGYKTLYAHAQKLLVINGQKIYRGQKIALIGSTGRSTGPHLHFEIRKGERPLNPISFIKQSRKYLIAFRK
jgi:hypothetical protein